MITIDIFSKTNPALGALILWRFAHAFQGEQGSGCELPIMFLPIPLILSKSIRQSFEGTNAMTGLYNFVEKRPEILIGLVDQIEGTAEITRESIIFGVFNEVLFISEEGLIFAKNDGFRRKPNWKTSEELGEMLSLTKRLGTWCGRVQSTKKIYYSLGLCI